LTNIDNMRKRAKTLVKQHRDRYYPVAARLRFSLPRFADLSDRAILDASFTLAEAQQIVAREAGYADWARATKESKTMSSNRNVARAARPILSIAHPQIFVADVTRASEFYVRKLGFSIEYLYGEPPFYGLVSRDRAYLNLRYVCEPVIDAALRDRETLLSANIPVDGVKELFLEFKQNGVEIVQTLKEQPWGATDFLVRDLDGNLICFASPTEKQN
jgi:catechol 2,3-dioxygenase-like lactoylglutathione lyase family enzyme